ncbi:MAG: TrpR-like protein YerC/YecD [Candidatus Peregrinibacteria bacterium Greene1014_49]|nr:MAG: TrpR-like protein YerC/YecD [Candidatus Peregrinibacteria bacterium Greene1014_49]
MAELRCAGTPLMKRTFTESMWRNDPRFKKLCKALLACRSEGELADFLRDVGTLSELYTWSERLAVAERLQEGESYREASIVTGASTTTVTRVASFLYDGEGGYQRILGAQHHHSTPPMRGEDGVVRRARKS